MNQEPIPVAIVYDFDGTLAPGNMQEASFIPDIGMSRKDFWDHVNKCTQEESADMILMYMHCMLERAEAEKVRVHREDFVKQGKAVKLFPGVQGWFERINAYGKTLGIALQHYIVSSGNTEIIEGTSIASQVDRVYASKFLFNHNDVACWPARAVNYITKTEYLIRINKGAHDLSDLTEIDCFVAQDFQPVPYANMVYIGDGSTDIPCFQKVKAEGGFSIAVFEGMDKKARRLRQAGHVQGIAPADYTEGKPLDHLVQAIIQHVSARDQFKTASDELFQLLESTPQACASKRSVSIPTDIVSQTQKHIKRDQVSATISAAHLIIRLSQSLAPYKEVFDHMAGIVEPYVKTGDQIAQLLEPSSQAVDQTMKALKPYSDFLNQINQMPNQEIVLDLDSLQPSPLPEETLSSSESEEEDNSNEPLA